MKSVPKLIRRFVGILLLSFVLLVIVNFAGLCMLMAWQMPDNEKSPYTLASQTAQALRAGEDGYVLPAAMHERLAQQDVWAILIADDTAQVVWKTQDTPASVPDRYTLYDVADLSTGYLEGYPTYTGEHERGVVVLGFPKDSYWKHTHASWNRELIVNLPQTALCALLVNAAMIFVIYVVANMRLFKSVGPITKGIQDLAEGKRVHIEKKGVLSQICAHIEQTSDVLHDQREQLRRKETARVNWIAGVSHDIRTPLSMVMGYASQLEHCDTLSQAQREKAAVIRRQSQRMRELISDLNLASKLEYDMQPLMKKRENAVAIVREVVVDFMNMDAGDKYPITWTSDEALCVCGVDADKPLLKRAVANLIHNSIHHNENGCAIEVCVAAEGENCIISVADDGVGADDALIDRLNHTPHYMLCDTLAARQQHGLGLLIVRQIVGGHGGRILIDRGARGGLRVALIIPRADDPPNIQRN